MNVPPPVARAERPPAAPIPFRDRLWQPCIGPLARLRVELTGDSMLVVNWANGNWPVRQSFYSSIVDNAIKTFFQWNHAYGVQPRASHTNWCRHVRREFNEMANDLATQGKNLLQDDFVVDIDWNIANDIESFPYIEGSWDGGYNPDSSHVGIGIVLKGQRTLPDPINPQWTVIARGHGRCRGCSAANAEVLAFQCLVELIDRVLKCERKFWPPFPPFQCNDC